MNADEEYWRVLADIREARQLLARAESLMTSITVLPDKRVLEPQWMLTARGEIGVKERRGKEHNPRVLEYLMSCHEDRGGNLGDWGSSRDETPWCSAFVNWCIERDEVRRGTRNAAAISWADYGEASPLRVGAIVVLPRVGGNHVAFLAEMPDEQGRVRLLGGNQDNRVGIDLYPGERVQHVRWPEPAEEFPTSVR